jgi:hypothetical protein
MTVHEYRRALLAHYRSELVYRTWEQTQAEEGFIRTFLRLPR